MNLVHSLMSCSSTTFSVNTSSVMVGGQLPPFIMTFSLSATPTRDRAIYSCL